jgi:hypothetical protein
MSLPKFVCLMILAGVTVTLALVIVLLSAENESTQQSLQARQLALNNGILGPQGQQISTAILQDMANASANNRDMRNLLSKYGFTVQSGVAAPAPAAGDADKAATKGKGGVRDE